MNELYLVPPSAPFSFQKRTAFTEILKRAGVNVESATAMIHGFLASGILGNIYYNLTDSRNKSIDEAAQMIRDLKITHKDIAALTAKAFDIKLKIKELEAPTPPTIFSRVRSLFFREATDFKIQREITAAKFYLRQTIELRVRSEAELNASLTAISYVKETRNIPFPKTPINEQVLVSTNFVELNLDALVNLFEAEKS